MSERRIEMVFAAWNQERQMLHWQLVRTPQEGDDLAREWIAKPATGRVAVEYRIRSDET